MIDTGCTSRRLGTLVAVLLVGSFMLAKPAFAQSPAAIVEDVKGSASGVQFMDYLAPGKVIRLGADDSIVLDYLKSCWREPITGGTITVGIEQSEVESGKVQRTRTQCDAGRIQLAPHRRTRAPAWCFAPSRRGRPDPNRNSRFTVSRRSSKRAAAARS